MAEKYQVLLTVPFPEELLDQLEEISPNLEIVTQKARREEEFSADAWDDVEVLYTMRILPGIEQAPKLRWIQFHWAGIDHAIDAPILKRPGVMATTLSGAAASQVSEYILMMLLGLGHHFPELLEAQKRVEWPKDRWERFSPRELRGSTVGLVGYGSIARQTARLLHPFGAKVLAIKKDARQPQDPGFSFQGLGDPEGDYFHLLYPPEALHSMLRECDFVVIATPLTPATRNLINAPTLEAMKPSAYLVDISRGGIVDHQALIEALREEKLAGAALDVYPQEPLPADSPLWQLPNVVLSPHISGNTPFYDQRAFEVFAENLRRYCTGQPLLNLVDLKKGY